MIYRPGRQHRLNPSESEKEVMKKTVLNVKGMKCSGCSNTIEEAVKACAGVLSVKAEHQQGIVEIEYEEGAADLVAIRKVIAEKGFTPA